MVVDFVYDKNVYRREIINEKKRSEAINDRKVVQLIESTVRIWCKQMERVREMQY